MEQNFQVTVTDRATGEIKYNATTKKLDLFIQHLSEGTSYLAAVTPTNKKGVGKPTHVIVDTLNHPAVELTLSEGADDGMSAGRGSGGGEDEWAVLTGALVGTLGCVTILVVASLVIRFCVCPTNRAAATAFAKADLSPTGTLGSGGSKAQGDESALPTEGLPFEVTFGLSDTVHHTHTHQHVTSPRPGGMEVSVDHAPMMTGGRKGILKHTISHEGWDSELDRMVNSPEEMVPPPPFSGKSQIENQDLQKKWLSCFTHVIILAQG